MKNDPDAILFIAFAIVWGILALGSTLHVRSRPTPQEKKKWFDRWAIAAGVIFIGVVILLLISWKQYLSIPVWMVLVAGIIFLTIRNTYFCSTCDKRSRSNDWFGKSYHCPHCGHRLR